MGMSTHVAAFKPADSKWEQMKAVHESCTAAGIPVPRAVDDYFEGESPDERGVKVDQGALEKCGAVTKYSDSRNAEDGFEIHLDRLPAGVKIVRVYNSW